MRWAMDSGELRLEVFSAYPKQQFSSIAHRLNSRNADHLAAAAVELLQLIRQLIVGYQ